MPEVVLIECEAHHHRALREAKAKLRAVRDELEELRDPFAPERDVGPVRLKYRADLEAIIRETGGEVLPIPGICHAHLVEKAVARRRPFDAKGDCYRDALIWETVIELLERDANPVIFVSRDHRAFAQSDKTPELADDLARELSDRGHSGRVELYFELGDFTEESPRARELVEIWTHNIADNAEFTQRLTEYLVQLAAEEATAVVGPAFSTGNTRAWRFLSFSNPRDLRTREAWVPPSSRSREAGLVMTLTLDYQAEAEAPWLRPGEREIDYPPPPSWPWGTVTREGAVPLVFEVRLHDRDRPTTTNLAGRLIGLPEPRSLQREDQPDAAG